MNFSAKKKKSSNEQVRFSNSPQSMIYVQFQSLKPQKETHRQILNTIMKSTLTNHIIMTTTIKLIFLLCFFPIINSKSSPSFPEQALPTKSGYLKIDPNSNSAMFYTFYEAQTPIASLSKTPLLIWLQGGPGCSSMVGNFYELGPWRVNPNNQNKEHFGLESNSGSWNRLFGLVFIDNPIGTGFSIAASTQDIPRNQHAVAKDLFKAIRLFIDLEPELFKSRPIYITGESYAGKYCPSIGYYILKKNERLPVEDRVNLAGVAIGNGLTDPITQVGTHALSAHFSGLINERQKVQLEKAQVEAIRLTKDGNWSEATNARNVVLHMLQNMTGLATLFDYRRKISYRTDLVDALLSIKEVKKALKVNESMVWEECSDSVAEALHEDVMKSVNHMVEYLVKNSKVLMYQGFFDLQDGVVSVEAWVKNMKWEGVEEYLSAERKIWKVNGELAGYVQKWDSLSQVVVLGAGHLLPADQALNSQAMIEDWVLEKGLFANVEEERLLHSTFRASL